MASEVTEIGASVSGKVELVWGERDVIVCDSKRCVMWPVSTTTSDNEDNPFSMSLGEKPESRHSQPLL